MSFFQSRGVWEIKWYQKKASTAISPNTLVTQDATLAYMTPATASSALIVGIALKKVASTDSDYAANTRIPVAIPRDRASEFIGDVTTGTIALADENKLFDLTDASGVDATANVLHQVKLKQFISTVKGAFTLNVPTIV